MKVQNAIAVRRFQDIPNIGPAMEKDFVLLGLKKPTDLAGKDAFLLYQKLCKVTGVRHDPCVLDTFIAAVDFMNGAPPRPWFYYSTDRKKKHPDVSRR